MRHRLFLLAVAALVPLVALAVGLTFYSLRQQQAALRAEAINLVDDIFEAVEHELFSQVEVLRALASATNRDGPDPDLSEFHNQASRFSAALHRWDAITLADLEGRQIINTRLPLGAPLPPVMEEATYRRAIRTREPVIGDVSGPDPSAGYHTPHVGIRVPVLRNGHVRHVLTAVSSPNRLSYLIARGVDPQWRSFLVDGAGRIAASARQPEGIGQRASEQTIAARSAGAEGIYEGLAPDGTTTITAFRRSHWTGWSTHVSIPLGIYNAPLIRPMWTLGGAILSALVLTLLFVEFLRRETLGRERATAQLQAAEHVATEKAALLEATLENMDQGLVMVDGDGIVQVCNRRAIELLDLPPDYWHSKPSFAAFIAHQVAAGEFAGLSEERVPWLKLKGNLLSAPPLYERTRPNGTVLEIRTVHLSDGTAVRTFTDITARKKAETELMESEARFRALATASVSIVWRADPDGSILEADGWFEYSGQHAYQGDRWLEVVHPEDRERVMARWRAIIASARWGRRNSELVASTVYTGR